MWSPSERTVKAMNKEYVIKEKYCPTRKMNVPVMVFSDSQRSPQCWDAAVCGENCVLSVKNSETVKKDDVKEM